MQDEQDLFSITAHDRAEHAGMIACCRWHHTGTCDYCWEVAGITYPAQPFHPTCQRLSQQQTRTAICVEMRRIAEYYNVDTTFGKADEAQLDV
ncbi:MAG: hypothetical protein AB1563_05995 [Bacillota bacterium]